MSRQSQSHYSKLYAHCGVISAQPGNGRRAEGTPERESNQIIDPGKSHRALEEQLTTLQKLSKTTGRVAWLYFEENRTGSQ